jgi:hypothetical protein
MVGAQGCCADVLISRPTVAGLGESMRAQLSHVGLRLLSALHRKLQKRVTHAIAQAMEACMGSCC